MRRVWEVVFLEALEATNDVKKSAEIAGISRSVTYEHRDRDDEFAARWDLAVEKYEIQEICQARERLRAHLRGS